MAKQSPRNKLISAEDREFIADVYADYEASKELKPIDDWQKYDEYVEDNQWGTANAKDKWKPKPQLNICWKVLRSIHANMTNGRFSVLVTCKRPLYEDISQNVSDVIEYYWDALDMHRKMSEAEWMRPKLGSVVLKAVWNPKRNDGAGDLDTFVVHPANFFPDPNITNPWDLQKGDFIDFVHPKTVKYVMQKYSKEADPLCKYTKEQLKDLLIPESSFSDTEIYGDNVTGITGRTPTSITGTEKTYRSLNHRDRVNLHEYWYRDDNNKLQVAWLAGWTLLKDSRDDPEMEKEGYYKHGRYPVVIIPYVMKDKRLWGRSEMQSLIGLDGKRDGLQDIINKMIQDFLVSLKTTGQPQMAYEHGRIKEPHKWTNNPELKIPVKGNPNTALKMIQGQITDVMPAVETFLTHVDRITNLWDVTQGRGTSATQTASGTLALLEQAMKPMLDVVTTMQYGLRELAEIWLEHLAEFVTVPREFVLDRGSGNYKVFEFNPSEILHAPKRMMDESGQVVNMSEDQRVDADSMGETRKLYFNIDIDVGATLTITRAYLVELGMNLFERQALDLPGLYKLLPEFPGKQDALERMTQAMEAQGQEQQGIPGMDEFIQSLPPEVLIILREMPPEQQEEQVQAMMQMQPEQLEAYIAEMLGGGQAAI